MKHLKLFEEFNNETNFIKAIVAKKYSHDQAEGVINILSDVHNIGGQFIDWTEDGRVILELSHDETRSDEDFIEFVENSEIFDEIIHQ